MKIPRTPPEKLVIVINVLTKYLHSHESRSSDVNDSATMIAIEEIESESREGGADTLNFYFSQSSDGDCYLALNGPLTKSGKELLLEEIINQIVPSEGVKRM